MSTGDQSDYMRGKMAVRGKIGISQAPKFMQDGFDKWADTNTIGVGGRLMAIPEKTGDGRKSRVKHYIKNLIGAADPGAGGEVPVKADVEQVSDIVDSAMGYANAFGLSNLIPDGIKKGAEKAIELGKKVKTIATDARKLLQTPGVIAKAESAFPGFGKVGVNAISDFMELVGFGKFQNSKKVMSMVKRSKPFKQYASGQFPETVDAFRKYASKRQTPKSPAELKQILLKQMEDVKDFATQYSGSAALKSGLKRQNAIRNLNKAPGVATQSWAETWAEWSKWIVETYKTLEAKAPIVISAFESPPMDSLIKSTPSIQDKQIGRKIANVTRIIFPEASKKVKAPDDKKDAPAAEQPAEATGSGSREDFANPNVKKDSSGMPLSYYLERADEAERTGSQPKDVIDAYRAKYRALFKKLEGGASCCSGCEGGGECRGGLGAQGAHISNPAGILKWLFSGKGRKGRKRGLGRSNRTYLEGLVYAKDAAGRTTSRWVRDAPVNIAGTALAALAGDKKGTRGITTGLVSHADVQRYWKQLHPDEPYPPSGWYSIARLADNEVNNPESDLNYFLRGETRDPMADYNEPNEYSELIPLWTRGLVQDLNDFENFPAYKDEYSKDTPQNRELFKRLFTTAKMNPDDPWAQRAIDNHFKGKSPYAVMGTRPFTPAELEKIEKAKAAEEEAKKPKPNIIPFEQSQFFKDQQSDMQRRQKQRETEAILLPQLIEAQKAGDTEKVKQLQDQLNKVMFGGNYFNKKPRKYTKVMPTFKGEGLAEDLHNFFKPPRGRRAMSDAAVALGAMPKGKGFFQDRVRQPTLTTTGTTAEQMAEYRRQTGKGRQPSAYAQFVKQFAAKHPGPDLMKRAAAAWKSQK